MRTPRRKQQGTLELRPARPEASTIELIEPPPPFGPTKLWRAFLAEMKGLPQTPAVQSMIELAESVLKRHERSGLNFDSLASKSAAKPSGPTKSAGKR